MSRTLHLVTTLAICLALGGCDAGADSGGAGTTSSAVIREEMPIRGTFDDLVVAYGQGAVGRGGLRVLALPLEVTLTEVDVVAGQHVQRGQRLALFVPSKAALAARVAAHSSVTVARDQRDRVARLLGDHLATNDQLGQAEKALRDAEATLAAQDTPGDVLRAPADGTVLSVDAQRDALVANGATLMTFVEGNRMGFAGGIEPVDMSRVHVGDIVSLRSLSGGGALAGRVSAVAGSVDPVSRLVDVKVATTAPAIQGAAYRAEIVVGALTGWRIPVDAVIGDEGARAVWQVARGKAHRVVVRVVVQRGDQALVDGAIDASQPLATIGAAQLDEGMQVRPMDSK